MPSKQLVLITGATGHIGFRALVLLLQAGYRARITVRKLEQQDKIKKTASIKPFLNFIEFVQVRDITPADAFDEAIKDVDLVVHIASPIPGNVDTGNANWSKVFIEPAVEGTLSVLKAASKTPSVKRVVITSSLVVLEYKSGSDVAGPYDIRTPRSQEAIQAFTNVFDAYIESKVAAHVAATEYNEREKPSFDLIRVLPGYVMGAHELCETQAELMSGSNSALLEIALGIKSDEPKLTHQVLLEDVARAHVLALKSDVAKDGDNILVAGNGGTAIPWDKIAEVIRRQFPKEVEAGVLKPVSGQPDFILNNTFDVTSSERALGFKFGGAEEMVNSLVGQYVALK